MTEFGSAAERYKELCGTATGALSAMRAHDRELATRLRDTCATAREDVLDSAERERVTRLIVRLRWEAAVEALWDERWLPMTPLPRPAAVSQRYDLGACELDIDRAFDRLEEALRRRRLFELPTRSRSRP
ncbi:hypothetical protein [Actinoalloteichus hymeniacidonis]|uniref:Uncharacterized protein n=1 Tax=Actinoalloteichus hymeniacidonis TaxID=340345 RepID=A0AAC9N1E3_9PSEU|nr:hypothetical protein [Actinoalloteichus hymeniacidonis]AOS65791.1 hypothetical protein TL08_25065 [Actinoalloteichus hymeniacidonis]MBB5906118.1 hypothetical protein [Actinoalloteichus hymeniacidonis]